MKPILLTGLLFLLFLTACEKGKDNLSIQYEAKIVGFDPNCGTCIVSFPDDLMKVKVLAGESPDNYYEIVNLNKGNFVIGQKLKVEIRKAEGSELQACISLYPSSRYKSIYVSDFENYSNLNFNDTIEIAYKDCINDLDRQCYICFDSVISDSRCPAGGVCVWEGEATARFKIEKYNNEPVYFNLKEGEKDAIVRRYHIAFIKLLPYPSVNHYPQPEEYKARIVVKLP